MICFQTQAYQAKKKFEKQSIQLQKMKTILASYFPPSLEEKVTF